MHSTIDVIMRNIPNDSPSFFTDANTAIEKKSRMNFI